MIQRQELLCRFANQSQPITDLEEALRLEREDEQQVRISNELIALRAGYLLISTTGWTSAATKTQEQLITELEKITTTINNVKQALTIASRENRIEKVNKIAQQFWS